MSAIVFQGGKVVLADRILDNAGVRFDGERITHVSSTVPMAGATVIDLAGDYLTPGFVELHVHGGDGADFMDGTPEAFQTICRCHARHGTTSLTPTSTVATMPQYMRFLE